MKQKKDRDYQTASLFLVLSILTGILVIGLRMVLFVPGESGSSPSSPVEAAGRAP